MRIVPAIDLKDGRVVRLFQGRYDREQVYDLDPLDTARRWKQAGAGLLHIVDLDGARSGSPRNLKIVQMIVDKTGMSIQFGGGVRKIESVKDVLEAGIERVVVGTAFFTDLDFRDKINRLKPDLRNRVVAGIDCVLDAEAGFLVRIAGWTGKTLIDLPQALEMAASAGLTRAVVTDIGRDGSLTGPNLVFLQEVLRLAPKMEITASGGVSSLEDIIALAELARRFSNLNQTIVGKALYEQQVDLKEAIERCGKKDLKLEN